MNKKKFGPEVKVGIFVVIVILGLAYLTTQINQNGFSLKPMSYYDLYFDNVSGMLPRTPVEYSGIRVGHVEKIEMAKNGGVRVRIRIQPDVVIYEDSKVSLQTRGLLGEKIIMIHGGGKRKRIPPGGAIHNTSGAVGFEDAVSNFSEVAKAIKDFIKGGQGKPSLQDIINNTTDISEDLRNLIHDRKGDLNKIVSNMRMASDAMKHFVKSDDPRAQSAFEKLQSSMDKLNSAATSLQNIMARVGRGEGTVGKLLKDDTTVNKMNQALDGINEFVGQIKQLEIGVGFRSEYMASEGEPIAVTSFRFRPAYDKYFLLEFTDGPLAFAKQSKSVTTTKTNPPGTTVTETETKKSDNFSVTAIFARRFYDLTLKAGLFRSSGYFGAEYSLFKDHLSLNFDAFNFNRPENPQLRLFAKLNFLKIFYLDGGVDDLIQENGRRNFFGGLGFILTDDDIKKLFGVLPISSKL